MPRTKYNYNNSKIFGIYDETNQLIYISHTTIKIDLHFYNIIRDRLMKLDLRSQIASYAYQNDMATGWRIKLIKNHPCEQRWQVEAKTQKLINIYKPIVNMQIRAAERFYQITKIKRQTIQCPCCVSLDDDSE